MIVHLEVNILCFKLLTEKKLKPLIVLDIFFFFKNVFYKL